MKFYISSAYLNTREIVEVAKAGPIPATSATTVLGFPTTSSTWKP